VLWTVPTTTWPCVSIQRESMSLPTKTFFPITFPIDLRQPSMLTGTYRRRTMDKPVRQRVAVVLAVGLLIVAAFQAALTLGAPLGAAAMGGAHPGQLPDAVRLVTGFATGVWLFAALLVLARGGRALVPMPDAVTRVGAWVLVGLLGPSALLNFASSSPWERFGWGPFTLVIFTFAVILARSGSPARPEA
jgi:hypothetical protein